MILNQLSRDALAGAELVGYRAGSFCIEITFKTDGQTPRNIVIYPSFRRDREMKLGVLETMKPSDLIEKLKAEL